MSKFKIQKNVPIPDGWKGKVRSKAVIAFLQCKVGDSFLIENVNDRERNAISKIAGKRNMKIVTRKEGNYRRIWRTQ
tara:strand:- start:1603 stop:1833 length:231 start_codon:yes stop_codon:yes gene_type:complete